MPIIQDRDVKFPYKRYRYYLQEFWLKAIVSQWLRRCTTVGVFSVGTETAQGRISEWCFFFFFCACVCVEMTKGLFTFCI